MAFQAKLEVDGISTAARLLHCNYEVYQTTDKSGRPSSEVYIGPITVTFELCGQKAYNEWMADNWGQKSGKIIFVKSGKDGSLEELEFKNAYVVRYTPNINCSDNSPATVTMTLSGAEEIIMNGVSVKNPRPEDEHGS